MPEDMHVDHHHDRPRHAERKEGREAVHAHRELTTVKDEIAKVVEKKDVHVHKTHEWLHKLGRATRVLLRDHEEQLDNAEESAAWVNDALDNIYDANKQIIALSKAIVAASGHRIAKDADFDKAGVADKAKAIEASIDKALALIPDDEKK